MTQTSAPVAQRLFRHRSPYALTEPKYEAAIELLSSAIAHGGPIAAVIGIAGGGTAPAEQLATQLGVPVSHLAARHNSSDALYVQATGTVTVTVPASFPEALAGRVVLVDDICGTGTTFTAVTNALAARLTSDARVDTVALCRNVGSPTRPSWWVWDVDDWVVFPWEPRPDIPVRPLALPERVLTP
ncbi:phosphoribosyltransferase family protein [Streptomyces sp. NPDC046862]|uniref:phosphoribosyltransferase family protein n=1 Tax=Streptomyces sp. NPDC046862 TaxID=3154603 RepID=UPI0034530B99